MIPRITKKLTLALLMFIAGSAQTFACATCYGASDSPLAEGMNWGIFTLLCVITSVLGFITLFFVYVGRRAARLAAADQSQNQTDQQL